MDFHGDYKIEAPAPGPTDAFRNETPNSRRTLPDWRSGVVAVAPNSGRVDRKKYKPRGGSAIDVFRCFLMICIGPHRPTYLLCLIPDASGSSRPLAFGRCASSPGSTAGQKSARSRSRTASAPPRQFCRSSLSASLTSESGTPFLASDNVRPLRKCPGGQAAPERAISSVNLGLRRNSLLPMMD